MKKFILFIFAGVLLEGCVVGAPKTQTYTSGSSSHIQIVSQKPQGCAFIAGVLGDQNEASWNRSEQWLENIRANAQRLGGNVVYLRGAQSAGSGASDEYFRDFYVNGVQYGALVYKCP